MERTCLHCGGRFIARVSNQKYCTEQCCEHARNSRGNRAEYKRLWAKANYSYVPVERTPKPCQCGTMILPPKRFCDSCRQERRRLASNESAKQYYRKQREIKPKQSFICRQCGIEFTPTHAGRNTFCTPRCAKRWDRNIRKLKLKSQTPDKLCIEPFGPWEIYQRDNYICQICGDKVNLAVSVLDNYAPSIDHIVPVSKGGHHVRSNVQCAHRFCNALKNDKPMERMFFAINRMGRAGSESIL